MEGAGVELAYRETGAGPAAVFVHGIADDGRAWDSALRALADRARAISYDRRGYGASGAPEPYERTTVHEQAEDAAMLLRALDAAPAVACGADLGALVVIDLLLRHRELLRGAVLVDPAAYPLVAGAAEAISAERMELERALRDSGPVGAVEAYLAPRAVTADRLERARAAPLAMFADYAALASLPLLRRELRRIELPVLVLDGPAPPPRARAAGDALAQLLPRAQRRGAEDPAAAVGELLPAGGSQPVS